MNPPPPPTSVRRNLRAIACDGVAFSLMVGLGETYIPAFALALGMSEVLAGWIVALPLLAGAILQLVSPAAVRALRSHRRWVIICAVAQATSFVGFVLVALSGRVPPVVLFLIATLYWGAGMGTGPAWNTWVGSLVPRPLRPRFFALRSRFAQAAVLVGVVIGGISLQLGKEMSQVLPVFATMFAAAGICRTISAQMLWSQSEPRPFPVGYRDVTVLEWLGRARHSRDGTLLLYLLMVQMAVQISGPFFTPYMLERLEFSYLEYLAVISVSFMAKMLAFPFLGGLAKRIGSQRLLYAAGIGIIPTSSLWIVSDTLLYLVGVQIVAGVVWAAYELTTFLLLFDHIAESERTSVLTTFNLANAVSTVIGALLGGFLLHSLGADTQAYLVLFGLSGAGRVLSLLLLFRLRAVSRRLEVIPVRALGVRPNTGSVDAPIVASMGERHEGTEARRHEGGEVVGVGKVVGGGEHPVP